MYKHPLLSLTLRINTNHKKHEMKKAVFTIIAMAAMLSAMASCWSKDYGYSKSMEFAGFTKIEAEGNYDIELIKSDESKAVLFYENPKDLEYFDIYETNGTLRADIRKKKNRWLRRFHGYPEAKLVIYAQELSCIRLSGASTLASADRFEAASFSIIVSGASEIRHLDIKGDKLHVDISGSSSINAAAHFCTAGIGLSGASDACLSLKAENLKIGISGSSDAEIRLNGNSTLKATASGASSAIISGEGESAIYHASGSSDIKADRFRCGAVKAVSSGASEISAYAAKSMEADASGASEIDYYGNPSNAKESHSGASCITRHR